MAAPTPRLAPCKTSTTDDSFKYSNKSLMRGSVSKKLYKKRAERRTPANIIAVVGVDKTIGKQRAAFGIDARGIATGQIRR
jgi:uncharacterized NAD-dependent epimerase/dehydratase family protein